VRGLLASDGLGAFFMSIHAKRAPKNTGLGAPRGRSGLRLRLDPMLYRTVPQSSTPTANREDKQHTLVTLNVLFGFFGWMHTGLDVTWGFSESLTRKLELGLVTETPPG